MLRVPVPLVDSERAQARMNSITLAVRGRRTGAVITQKARLDREKGYEDDNE